MGVQLVGTLFYVLGDAGWSETYGMKAIDYSTAANDLTDLAAARSLTQCNDVTNIGGRVSDLAIQGDALTITPVGVGQYTPPGPAVGGSAPPYVGLRIRLNAAEKPHSIRFLRGFPQFAVLNNVFIPDVPLQNNLITFLNLVRSVTYILTIKEESGGKTVTPNVITAYNFNGVWSRKPGRPFGQHRGRRTILR